MRHRVIFVTRTEMERTVRDMKMDYAASLQKGVRLAKQLRGEHAAVSVIPHGVSVMISRKEHEKQ